MKKLFLYNVLEGKDKDNNDLQWWEEMEDGTQLLLPLTEDDAELAENIANLHSLDEKNIAMVTRTIALVNAKMPNIYLNMEGYVKGRNMVLVGNNTSANLFCFSTQQKDGQIPISWNICDICGIVARFLKLRPNTERLIMLSNRTHITDIRIEKDDEGDIIITPTIENL